ncbi:MAG TPA: RNA polymerase subunit sigma-70 [Flavobacteriales bacterium]|nr:RNA polymerase subunit sigma-70 [Flavobacteriales bacterium]
MNATNLEENTALLLSEKKYDSAFQQVIKYLAEPLYWHVRKIVISHENADDVIQEVYTKIWLNLKSFEGRSKVKTWAFTIATNESLQFLRKEKKHRNLTLDDVESPLSSTLTSDPYFDGDEIEKKLQLILLQLPDKQRITFNMKYFDDMKYEEISEILGTSIGALKASYHHAVRKIKSALQTESF